MAPPLPPITISKIEKFFPYRHHKTRLDPSRPRALLSLPSITIPYKPPPPLPLGSHPFKAEQKKWRAQWNRALALWTHGLFISRNWVSSSNALSGFPLSPTFFFFPKAFFFVMFKFKNRFFFWKKCSLELLKRPFLLPCDHIFCKLVNLIALVISIIFIFVEGMVLLISLSFFLSVHVCPKQYSLDPSVLSVKLNMATQVGLLTLLINGFPFPVSNFFKKGSFFC